MAMQKRQSGTVQRIVNSRKKTASQVAMPDITTAASQLKRIERQHGHQQAMHIDTGAEGLTCK